MHKSLYNHAFSNCFPCMLLSVQVSLLLACSKRFPCILLDHVWVLFHLFASIFVVFFRGDVKVLNTMATVRWVSCMESVYAV